MCWVSDKQRFFVVVSFLFPYFLTSSWLNYGKIQGLPLSTSERFRSIADGWTQWSQWDEVSGRGALQYAKAEGIGESDPDAVVLASGTWDVGRLAELPGGGGYADGVGRHTKQLLLARFCVSSTPLNQT